MRYCLQCGVGRAEQVVDVGRHRGVGQRNDIAVLQWRRGGVARQQLDVGFADRGVAVHLGLEVRRDIDARFQGQHRLHPGVGEPHRCHPAHLKAAVGDIAGAIQPTGFDQLHRHRVAADAESIAGSLTKCRNVMASTPTAITVKTAS